MTLDDWLRAAHENASRKGLPELAGLVDTLASSTRALRAADWNQPADASITEPEALAPGTTRDFGGGTSSDREPPPAAAAGERAGRAERPARVEPAIELRTIAELAPSLRDGEVSSRDLTEACLTRISTRNPRLNTFITVTAKLAREQAALADREIARGSYRGPLHGIPVSLKDLIDLRGVPTTAASRIRQRHVAARDAEVTARLRAAGAVIVGKCNLHEFAFGTTNEDSAFGVAHHPTAAGRSPGGSSGGSAAGVVAGMSVASVGTDTGGSIRIPAAACGLVGFKPPFGVVPCDGVVPLAWTLDHVGPITRCARDAWWVYRILAGAARPDLDPPRPIQCRNARLGLLRDHFMDRLDPEVRRVFEEGIARLVAAGADVGEAVVPHAALTAPVYLHTVLAEAAAYHAPTLEARGAEYTPAVRVRLEMARYVLGEDYARAQQGRSALRSEVGSALAGRDALLLPTLPIPAPLLGSASVDVGGVRDSVRNATLRLTQLFDLTGHPAVTLPCGVTRDGLPVGLQLVAGHDESERLLGLAEACETALAT